MPVTIKDIARRVGVTHSTVSRALRGSPLVSDETAQRIRQAASDLDYFPSAAARSLKTHQTRVLGVIVSNIDDPFFSEILQGIEDIAQENGYNLFIASSQRDSERQQTILQAMRQHRVDGIIICSTSFRGLANMGKHDDNAPIVIVNNQSAENYRYSIYHDDVDGSRQMTRHLISLGHKKIVYLGNSLSGRTTTDRLAGYQQEMAAANLDIPDGYAFHAAGGEPESGLAGLNHFLGLPNRPTAIFCFNDMMAFGVLKGLQQTGICVPAEISVSGFDNILFSAFTNPALTTFEQPKYYIGSEAARLVLGLLDPSNLDFKPDKPNIRVLRGKLLVRQSTAPPPFID